MIAIVNRTETESNNKYGSGTQIYSLQINDKVLMYFTHVFEDGLSKCLEKATEAARNYEQTEGVK